MSNALIDLKALGITRSEEQERALSDLTRSGDYLPALRVYGSSTTVVKQGKFPLGHFGLYYSQEKIIDLGDTVDVLVIDYRPRASIMMSDEQPISYYNPNSDNFINVKTKSLAGEQGYLAGLEYLLWFPSVKLFGLFLMGNKTLRRESENVKSHTGKAATLKIKFIPSKQYGGWHGCEVLSCDVPFELPDNQELKEVFETKFANPKDSEVGVSNDSEQGGRVR